MATKYTNTHKGMNNGLFLYHESPPGTQDYSLQVLNKI